MAHETPGIWLDLGHNVDPSHFRAHGLHTRTVDDRLQLTLVGSWRPRWPIAGDLAAIDLVACAPATASPAGPVGTISRIFEAVPLDPFLRGIPGISHYRGAAQREAVLAAVRCPPGGVLHVLLPTGTGKSLVGLARGLTDRSGTTIVVVPTVALAIDQERKALGSPMAEALSLPDRLAYIGDLADEAKHSILERIVAGTQRLVFTSPEALINGRLASRVHELASRGGLSALVIDEAHLVATWGESFRPVFQVLPALRDGLIDAAKSAGHRPLATITMSGTLTSEGLATLQRLFAGEPSEVVGGTWLRPEPRFLNATFANPEQRDTAVIEALAYLPRPAIVYVSLRERTEELAAKIRAAGYSRVATFHGDTNPAERRSVLEGWSGSDAAPTRYDVVVGNAAFGLGIDVPNVRAIVHACVPETFDRFYQEVGRAGRDGHASVSLLMSAPGDLREAAGLRSPKPITPEVAWPRLVKMLEGSELVDGSWHTVDVARRVTGGSPTEADIRWNIHILATMRQAELVELRTRPLPRTQEQTGSDGQPDDKPTYKPPPGIPLGHVNLQFQIRWNDVVVATEEDWANGVAEYRRRTRAAADISGKAVEHVVGTKRCVALTAREQYRLTSTVGTRTIDWSPIGVCNGCPSCGPQPHRGPSVAAGFTQELDSLLQGVSRFCSASGSQPLELLVRCATSRDVRQTLQQLVGIGFPLIVGDDLPLDDDGWRAALRASPQGWVITEANRVRSGFPTVVVLPDRFKPQMLKPEPSGVVFLASSTATRTTDKFPITELRAWIPASRVLEEVIPCPS